MGQCYAVYLKAKVKDGAEFVWLSAEYLKNIGIREDCFEGEDLTTPIGNIKFVMAAHQGQFDESTEDGFPFYRSWFDASYSWELVLYEWYRAVSPALEDDSGIEVYPDHGHWDLCIEHGSIAETIVEEPDEDEDDEDE